MSIKDIDIKTEYRSFVNDIPKEFYEPLLKEAVLYQRAVGFFSSSSLTQIYNGIEGLVCNNGHIQLIASPKLSEEDINAIQAGYEERKIIENALLRELKPSNEIELSKLSYISKLIAEGILDVKIAFLSRNNERSMYHEKLGIISDKEGNKVAFSGSMNESENAFHGNYEAFDVFCSWTHDSERVFQKEMAFNAIWNDYEPGIKTIDFPVAVKEKMLKAYVYSGNNHSGIEDIPEIVKIDAVDEIKDDKRDAIYIPDTLNVRDYQTDAKLGWEKNGFRGIFDMATGTGKTITALLSIQYLFEKNNKRLGVIIVCPYQHLVEQWVEDIEWFGMKPIIGYSASPQKKWKKNFEQAVKSFNLHVSDHFCLVTTIDSLKTKAVYDNVQLLSDDVVFVVDEAHNVGATNTRKYLPNSINYRLALSATIDRHNDAEGTQSIFDYFGEKCIEYSLKDAIENDMLTPYYYHPIVSYLEDDELQDYLQLTATIARNIQKKKGKIVLNAIAKQLLIKRARLVAGARSKLGILRKIIEPFKDDNYLLVYCGATSIDADELDIDLQGEIRQIEAVADILGNQLNMRVGRFTSLESPAERMKIRETFAEGKQLQALVAIKCLDEGVNIPSIKTAFILASSTNPKEYIQRRGRVLRKFEGKRRAVIYDFITLPFDLNRIDEMSQDLIESTKGLVKRELIRIMDFAEIADNPSESMQLIMELKEIFGIKEEELVEGGTDDVI